MGEYIKREKIRESYEKLIRSYMHGQPYIADWRFDEMIESLPIIVIKKDGARETLGRQKLLTGMLRACEKRPVSIETLDHAITDIETVIQNSLDREVSSDKIGELVMEKLKDIDEVAYVRFASVYRQFKDINTFMTELNKLLSK